jgi:CMP-N-acetylneuraminic acid synthetase
MPQITAFVPIKLNSQRLPNKNILPLGDRSLSWYVFNALLGVKEIDEVCVFCSEERIMDYLPAGVKFIQRDASLDGNLIKGNEIYQSFIDTVDSDYYLLAHTTSPFMSQGSIRNAVNKVLNQGYDSALSVQKKQTFIWYQGKTLNYSSNNVPRTQDIEPIYIETSGFYLFEKQHFLSHESRIGLKPYFQEVSDLEAIDIDTKEDYELAMKLMQRHNQMSFTK